MDSQSTIGVKVRVDLEPGNSDSLIQEINRVSAAGNLGTGGPVESILQAAASGPNGIQGQANRANIGLEAYQSAMDAFSLGSIKGNKHFEDYNLLYREWDRLTDKTSPESVKLQEKMKSALDRIYREQFEESKKIVEARRQLLNTAFGQEGGSAIADTIMNQARDTYLNTKDATGGLVPPMEDGGKGGMNAGLVRYLASSGLGALGTGLSLYAQHETAWGTTAMSHYNAQMSYEMNKLSTALGFLGTVIGGGIGFASGGGLFGVAAGGAIGATLGGRLATFLNIDNVNKQKFINAVDPTINRSSQAFDNYSVSAMRAWRRVGAESLSEKKSYESLGLSDADIVAMKAKFSGVYGYSDDRFDSMLNYAKANGMDLMEVATLMGSGRFGFDIGTSNIDNLARQAGLTTGSQKAELAGWLTGQAGSVSQMGYSGQGIGNAILSRLNNLNPIFGAGSIYSNPLAFAGQSMGQLDQLTGSLSNPAHFAILAQAYGLGTETDYAGFLKRVNQGYNPENLKDVATTLRRLYGGDETQIRLAIQNLTGSKDNNWLSKVSGFISSGNLEALKDYGMSSDDTRADGVTYTTQAERDRARLQNIDLRTGKEAAEFIRKKAIEESELINDILIGSKDGLVKYFEEMRKALNGMRTMINGVVANVTADNENVVQPANKGSYQITVPGKYTSGGN